jgi:hypothetical protein
MMLTLKACNFERGCHDKSRVLHRMMCDNPNLTPKKVQQNLTYHYYVDLLVSRFRCRSARYLTTIRTCWFRFST